MATKEEPVPTVKPVSLEPISRYPKIWPRSASFAPVDHLARPGHPEAQEMEDRKVVMEPQEVQANLAALDPKDHRDRKEMTADQDSLVPKDHPERTEQPVPRDRMVTQDHLDPLDQPAAKETMESLALPVESELQDLPDRQETRQTMAPLANLAQLVHLVHLAKMLNIALAPHVQGALRITATFLVS